MKYNYTFDDGKDCLCSALVINCCQFGCFLRHRPRSHHWCYNYENPNWMANLAAVATEKKLTDLILPGTHNSASNTKWIPFSAIGICQNVSVYEQLIRGSRYIDLRIGSGSERRLPRRRRKNATIPTPACRVDDIVIVHGILNGASFPDSIKEIDTFLNVHDGEFIIIDIQFDRNKHNLSNEQRLHLLEFVSFIFKNKLITHADATSWFQLKTATLGELLLVHKKNVLILLNDGILCDFYHDGTCYDANTIARKFGCHSNHHFLTNQWHNSSCPRTLLDKNATFLEKNRNCSNKFVVSQLVLTPQPPKNFTDIIRLLLGSKSLRPVSLARELYRTDFLETSIRNNAEKKLSIVLLDFIDLCPQLVRFLIGLNSPKNLSIMNASVTSIDGSGSSRCWDVTDTMNKLKTRNNSIYVLNFKSDLGVSVQKGTLRLRAQFDDNDDDGFEEVIPFNVDTEYLLCDL